MIRLVKKLSSSYTVLVKIIFFINNNLLKQMTLHISKDDTDIRLDKLLPLRFPSYSRQYFQYLIQNGLVLVNGSSMKKSHKLEENDEIFVTFLAMPEISLNPENIALDILFEDDHILAVNKPPNMVVHPAVGNWTGTFVNALLYHCKELPNGDGLRPGVVHRLDKDTSGVLLAAKTIAAHKGLVDAFSNKQVKKSYIGICVGNPQNQTIETYIVRHPVNRQTMMVSHDGKGRFSRTICENRAHKSGCSLLRLFPETGRTHQIRVHLKSIGTPILGDQVYGREEINKKLQTPRQLLHSYSVQFTHPISQQLIEITAPLPQDMGKFVQMFGDNIL